MNNPSSNVLNFRQLQDNNDYSFVNDFDKAYLPSSLWNDLDQTIESLNSLNVTGSKGNEYKIYQVIIA